MHVFPAAHIWLPLVLDLGHDDVDEVVAVLSFLRRRDLLATNFPY